jgi:uncharacterized protein YecT (DUF1311 family)
MSFAVVGISSAALSAGIGAFTSINAAKQQKRSQAELERQAQNSPLRKESKSLNDYYQQALNRFKESPYQSAAYQQAMQNARRTTASGLGALQDRRSAIGGISRLGGLESGASQRAVALGEQMQAQRFNELGRATQMKKRDEDELFDINVMTPYQRKLQLEQMKGAAAGERYNAGMQMVGQGLSNAAMVGMQYSASNPKVNQVVPQPDFRQVMADAHSAKLNQSFIPQNNSRIRNTRRNVPLITANPRKN